MRDIKTINDLPAYIHVGNDNYKIRIGKSSNGWMIDYVHSFDRTKHPLILTGCNKDINICIDDVVFALKRLDEDGIEMKLIE